VLAAYSASHLITLRLENSLQPFSHTTSIFAQALCPERCGHAKTVHEFNIETLVLVRNNKFSFLLI
jgi:hypothetical protein